MYVGSSRRRMISSMSRMLVCSSMASISITGNLSYIVEVVVVVLGGMQAGSQAGIYVVCIHVCRYIGSYVVGIS